MNPCKVSHCLRTAKTKGLCEAHYQKHWRGLNPEDYVLELVLIECPVEGCIVTVDEGKVCQRHARQIRAGEIDAPDGVAVTVNPMCRFPGCSTRAKTKKTGLCSSHAEQLRLRGELKELQMRKGGPCSWPNGCESEAVVKGRCRTHYNREPQPPKECCKTEGCDKNTRNQSGYCTPHQIQFDRWGETWIVGSAPDRGGVCVLDGCENRSHREGMLCKRHNSRKKGHNISTEKFCALFADPKCSACGAEANLCIDHDHSCCPAEKGCDKCVRGLLCRECNYALGFARDDEAVLIGLLRHLTQHALASA